MVVMFVQELSVVKLSVSVFLQVTISFIDICYALRVCVFVSLSFYISYHPDCKTVSELYYSVLELFLIVMQFVQSCLIFTLRRLPCWSSSDWDWCNLAIFPC